MKKRHLLTAVIVLLGLEASVAQVAWWKWPKKWADSVELPHLPEIQRTRAEQDLAGLTGDPMWKPTFAFRAGYPEREALASPRRPVEQVVA